MDADWGPVYTACVVIVHHDSSEALIDLIRRNSVDRPDNQPSYQARGGSLRFPRVILVG